MQGSPFTEAFRERGWAADVAQIGAGPLPPDVTVLPSAEDRPLVYARMFGKGRVHYNAFGHDERALRNGSHRRLVRQGVKWAAGISPGG
jgi:type 1 glutamine amidotransferase